MSETLEETRRSRPQMEGVAERSPFLRGLPPRDLQGVLDVGRPIRRARGQALLRTGVDEVLLLLTGAAKEHLVVSESAETVLGLLGPGEVAGITGALGTSQTGDVTALEATEALVLPGHHLRSLAHSRPAVALACLQTAAQQLHGLRTQVLAFASTSTSQRVVHRLVELAERFGETADGEVRIRPQLTQQELASWADVSRESAAKTLHDLRRARIVITRRRSLTILDLEALRRRQPLRRHTGAREPFTLDLTETGDRNAARRF